MSVRSGMHELPSLDGVMFKVGGDYLVVTDKGLVSIRQLLAAAGHVLGPAPKRKAGAGSMSAKACEHCEYERGSSCHFPDPQRGGEAPFMAAAAMPDPRDGGKNCIHFRASPERTST